MFFATGGEIRHRLALLERSRAVKYVRCDQYPHWRIAVLRHTDLPDLGTSATGSDTTDPSYLVLPRWRRLRRTWLFPDRQPLRFVVDQAENEVSTVISFGGQCGTEGLLAGRLATIHVNRATRRLHAAVAAAITSGLRRFGTYWVSPEAEKLHREQGYRLVTMHIKQKAEFDLQLSVA